MNWFHGQIAAFNNMIFWPNSIIYSKKLKNGVRNRQKNRNNFEGEIHNEPIIEYVSGRMQAKLPKQMRSFTDSQKSKKTVASMIERKDGKDMAPPKKNVKIIDAKVEAIEEPDSNGGLTEDVIIANRRKMAEKLSGKKKADSK